MAGTLAAGGAVGVPFNALYEAIKHVVVKTRMFRPLVEDLRSKIEELKSLIDEMETCNMALGISEEELRGLKMQMQKGPDLIRKCSNLSMWKTYKKYKYSNQLLGLQNSLQNLLLVLSVQQARDGKLTLVAMKNTEKLVQRVDANVETLIKLQELNVTNQVRSVSATAVQNIENQGVVQNLIDCEAPELPRVTVGLDEPLMELKMKLLKDDKVSTLVLTAPGGSGKTTLATKFCQDEEVKGTFKNNIVFVTVSKKANFNLIVQALHQCKGIKVPTFEEEATALKQLHKYLKEEGETPVLLVLDDVWPESKSLLEIFDEVKRPNFKILVTSRSQFSGYGSVYHLRSLNDADAMTLFRSSASLGDGYSSVQSLQWTKLITKIVDRCKGHPLAIKVVGKSLRGQSFEFWKKREKEWSKGDSIIDSETEVLRCLQSSFDALDEKGAIIKDCFLDLGSFPEDQKIPVAALIDMWSESHDLHEDFLAVTLLQELTTRSLADLVTRKDAVEGDEYYNEHFVTQHDLLRELAIYQTKLDPEKQRLIIGNNGDNLPKCLRKQTGQPIKPSLLSISSDGVFSENLQNIELAQVEVLVLNFDTKEYALPGFVDKMENLKVLLVTNNGLLPAEISNFHLLDSLPNLRRIRLERISISSITKNPVHLKSLKKISFFMCSIGEAFNNCSFQVSHAFPNLEEMHIDYCKDLVELPDELCNLVHLNKLSITNCHKLSALPQEIGNLENVEVLRLRSCTDLTELPSSTTNLKKLNFLDISYCLSIKELPKQIGEMSSLICINMRECSRLKALPVSICDLENNLEEVICDDETEELWEPFLPRLNKVVVRAVKEEFNLRWLQRFQF